MPRKFPRTKSLERKQGEKLPKWRILIVCEGSITEPQYFKDFSRYNKSQIIDVEIYPKGGPVRALVGRVKDLQEEMQRKAKRSKDSFAKLFRVWGVPDVDEHPKFQEAMQLAREHNLNIALSNPCFEVWGLLHFNEQDSPLHRHQAQKKLEDYMPGYSHDDSPIFNYDVIRDKHLDAICNAKRGLARRIAEDDAAGNPSSNVCDLIEELLTGPQITP